MSSVIVTGNFLPALVLQAGLSSSPPDIVPDAPTVNSAPSISGTPEVGQTLTAVSGSYTGSPTVTKAWLRNGSAISGATGGTYVLVDADLNANITYRETAANLGGSVESTSNALGLVTAPLNPATLFASGKKGFWFDYSDAATVFSDTAGTTPATLNGPVRRVNDKSGNGNHFVQDTAAQVSAPTLREDSGGRRYLEYANPGTHARNLWIPSISFPSDMDIFTAIKPDANLDKGMMFTNRSLDAAFIIGYWIDGVTDQTTGATVEAYQVDGRSITPNNGRELRATIDTGTHTFEALGVNMSSATSLSFGSYANFGATNDFTFHGRLYGMIAFEEAPSSRAGVRAYLYGKMGMTTPSLTSGLALGDSTVALESGMRPVIDKVTTDRQPLSLALAGDTIAGQKSLFIASNGKAFARFVVIQVGHNDVVDSGRTSAQIIANYQDLVDTVRAGVSADCKIFVSAMTPAKQRYIDFLGATPGAAAYAKWQDLNAAILGTGITGVDGRIPAIAALNDGSDNLAAAYDSGDHIHPNQAGRDLISAQWQTTLGAAGVL